jgi:arylsulfatase A-like enzyme
MKIKMKFILLVMLGFAMVGYSQSNDENTFKPPNILIILLDDAGYVDFGFMGSKDLCPPEIDKLASSGRIFADAHVSATVCAPSRASLLTGIYQQRFGF